MNEPLPNCWLCDAVPRRREGYVSCPTNYCHNNEPIPIVLWVTTADLVSAKKDITRLKVELEEVTNERDNYRWKLNKMDCLDD